MSDFYDATLSPAPPVGGPEGVGDSPYPFNDYADVAPSPPCGDADYVGASPYPVDSSGEVSPKPDRHDGQMDLHRGVPKPGSFGADHDGGDRG